MTGRFTGSAVGGPYNGMRQAHEKKIWRVESNVDWNCGEYRWVSDAEEGVGIWCWFPFAPTGVKLGLNVWAEVCHEASKAGGWWDRPRNIGEMFMLMVSELSEGFEGIRKDARDDHLPHRTSEEVELADLLIRVFDYAGWKKLDLEGAVREKMAFNAVRADHKPEARAAPGGKKF